MEEEKKLIEWKGTVLAIATLIFSVFFFNYYSDDLYYSTLGAIMSALLVWGTYLVMRVMFLALKN